ncbi:MAG: hypothetical protein ACI8WT_004929, partial [Clostridium sp.]
MITYENCEYYSVKEVADIFNIKSKSSVMQHVKKKDDFKNEHIKIKATDYIKKSFIDNIIKNRDLSVNRFEAAKLINRSERCTFAKLHEGKISYFFDSWDSTVRIYKKDLEEFLSYKECYSTDDLAAIFSISTGNINKKIRGNYSNVNRFKKNSIGKGVYIEKEFLNHLKYIEQTTMLVEDASKKIGIRPKDIANICMSFKDDILHRDFCTAKLRVDIDMLETISEIYDSSKIGVNRSLIELKIFLIKVVMSEEKLQEFCLKELEVDINRHIIISNKRKCISAELEESILDNIYKYYENNKDLNVYEDNDETFTLQELSNIFQTAIVTMARKIRRGYCDCNNFILPSNKEILVKKKYLDYLRKCKFASVFTTSSSEITKEILKRNKKQNILVFDLFSSLVMIKVKDLSCLEDNINSIYIKYYINKDRRLIKGKVNDTNSKPQISIGEGYIALNDIVQELGITRKRLDNKLKKLICEDDDCAGVMYGRKKFVKLKVLDEIKKSLESNKKDNIETCDVTLMDDNKKNLDSNKNINFEIDNIKVLDVLKEFKMTARSLHLSLENKFNINFKNHIIRTNKGIMLITNEFYFKIKDLLKREYSENYIEMGRLLATLGAKEKVTLRHLIKKHNIKITKNIELFNGKKYVNKSIIKVIKTEVDNFSKEYLKKIVNKYIDKVNLMYILEKYTLNRRELENILAESL